MKVISTIQKLQDELATLAEISKEIPLPYKTIIDAKIVGFRAYLNKILTIETECYNYELQNYASDVLTELESQQYKENTKKH